MKTIKVNKQGISLIVLVITIIVMIILAAAIILSLDNAGIINKANQAVQGTNLAQAKNLAALKWTEAYLDDSITDIEGYVISELAKQGITQEDYKITVTENGVDVELKGGTENEETDWSKYVAEIVNDVPIPKGFVVSPYEGEKTKDGGLVIYELASGETVIPSTETHQTSLTTRNQYVWVPVEDFLEFARGSYDNTTRCNVLGYSKDGAEDYYWEVVINTSTNIPLAEQDSNYMTSNTLAEVQAMYASVKEYKGFYIARYEAGIDVQRTEQGTAANLSTGTSVYSRMNKIPYTYIPWTWNNAMNEDTNGAVEVARSMYPAKNTNSSVVSTLTYGVQWDATLQWWLDVKAKDINGNEIDLNNSTSYGNYYDHKIALGDLNPGARYAVWSETCDESDCWEILGSYQDTTSNTTKEKYTGWELTTGALRVAKVNNIYDMAGNIAEWTMEGQYSHDRILRGGESLYSSGNGEAPVTFRNSQHPKAFDPYYGFRACLYIRK